MDWETFAERLTDAQSRLHHLRLQRLPDTADLALRELDDAFHELAAAQDELRTQAELLADARRELADQRRRYRMLFVSAPAAYLVTTPAGIVRDANQQAGALLNVRPRFLIGKPLVLYVAASQRRFFRERLRLLTTPGIAIDEWALDLHPRGGHCFEASATVVCGTEPTQHSMELQWLIFDVTTRRREERALQQANAVLEERVADRTRELEASGRAKDDFLASLSHELRTPVNVIRGFARMLRGGALDLDARARAIEAIDRNAERQTRLVADLLDVARINVGRFALRQQRIDLRSPFNAARETASVAAESKQVRLIVQQPDTPVWIWGDTERLQQAFDNLLANAIKFTPVDGHVRFELEADGPHWQVSVRDSGIGIVPEFMPHLFERFRQADSSTSAYGGLGLGLSIVHYIIQMHGGTVAAYSAGRGRGATFTCTLPSYSPRDPSDSSTSNTGAAEMAKDHV